MDGKKTGCKAFFERNIRYIIFAVFTAATMGIFLYLLGSESVRVTDESFGFSLTLYVFPVMLFVHGMASELILMGKKKYFYFALTPAFVLAMVLINSLLINPQEIGRSEVELTFFIVLVFSLISFAGFALCSVVRRIPSALRTVLEFGKK